MVLTNFIATVALIGLCSISGNCADTQSSAELSLRYQAMQEERSEVDTIEDPTQKLEAYKELREKYSDIYTSPSFNEAFTEADIKKICRAVETETYEADFISKSHIAEVVYARLDDKNFPDTVNKVVVRGQFAFGRSKISPDTRLAVEYAYYFPSEVHGALYFHNGGKREAKTSWHGQTYITTDDVGHNFYGSKGW